MRVMKANYTFARHTLSAARAGILESLGKAACRQNAYIMRTKCDHFHICEFFNVNASTTYNFNPLRCTHSQTALPFLPVDNQNLLSESHNIRLDEAVPFSLGQGRRSLSVKMRIQNSAGVRDKPVPHSRPSSPFNHLTDLTPWSPCTPRTSSTNSSPM